MIPIYASLATPEIQELFAKANVAMDAAGNIYDSMLSHEHLPNGDMAPIATPEAHLIYAMPLDEWMRLRGMDGKMKRGSFYG